MDKENKVISRKIIRTVDKSLRIILYALLFLIALSLFIPVIWMLINSFKADFEYYLTEPFVFAEKWIWENYSYIFSKMKYVIYTDQGRMTYGLLDMFYNSILYSVMDSVYPPILGLMCAYVISRFRFPGRNFIFNLGIVLMILPIFGTGAANMILKRQLGIYDNMFLLVLTSPATSFSGFGFLMFYAAFNGLPKDFSDAARVDGASNLRIMIQIMVPMVLPIYVMMLLTGFIGAWNDWSTFLFWLPSRANIALGMYQIQSVSALEGATMPQVLAAFVIVAIPTILMYTVAHPVLMKNFNIGGIKG